MHGPIQRLYILHKIKKEKEKKHRFQFVFYARNGEGTASGTALPSDSFHLLCPVCVCVRVFVHPCVYCQANIKLRERQC